MLPEVLPTDTLSGASPRMRAAAGVEPFLGDWELDPTSCRYEYGDPPASAVARIGRDEDCLVMTTEWISESGRSYTIVLQGLPDGKEHAYDNPILADTFCIEVGARTLEAVTRKGSSEVSRTTRTLSSDGLSLEVTQRGLKPDGTSYTNFLVYRRA